MARPRPYKGRYKKGWIYLVHLSPNDRVKIGFTIEEGTSARLVEATRWVPDAKLIDSWPAMSSWETLARKWLVGQANLVPIPDTELLTGVIDIGQVREEMNRLFFMLPAVDTINTELGDRLDTSSDNESRSLALVENTGESE